jgi:hypothetical protein
MSKQNPIPTNKRRSPKTVFLPPGFNPKFATFNEACAYARVCRYTGYQRVADRRWRSFKDGGRRMVEFASVIEDLDQQQAASPTVVKRPEKRPIGRPRKPKPEAAASAAE